ncbi:MAG: Asp-tRNA(Asn)/Glu-tRNA(Gln) amidotransferase subunit GatC [Bacteroidota bacterium]
MAVTLKDVEHVANLARLEFSDEEKKTLMNQLNRILEYMEKLNELDTSKVEPLSHVIPLTNVFREDKVKPSLSASDVLKNAPAKTDKFFKVPKVIEQ